ncbi:EthD family reductase [Nocardioides korecus]
MTYQLTVVYGHPTDPAAFDEHYATVHGPLAAKIPGLLSYTSHKADPGPDGSPADHYLVAVLTFADRDAFRAGFGGPEGQAAGADVPNFATGGASMLTGEVTTYV